MGKTGKIALCALLTALAMGLSLLERTIPLELILPLPGVKLGLANVVTLFALFTLGRPPAAVILLCRCVLTFLVAGSLTGLFMSFFGGAFALFGMILCKKWHGSVFSIYGISIVGAACHGMGQIACACVLTGSISTIFYAPLLLLTAIPSGWLTGFVANNVIKHYGGKLI